MNVLSAGHRQSLEAEMTPVGSRRTTRLLLVSLCFGFVVAWAGCDIVGTSQSQPASEARLTCKITTPIVDSLWLARRLGDKDLVIVDTRSKEEYQDGHIAGAINIPTNSFLHSDPAQSRNIAPVAEIQDILGEAGIAIQDSVVVYAGKDYRQAARVFWVLEVHGLSSVAVLNGGYVKWKQEQLPVTRENRIRAPARFVAQMRTDRLATKLGVLRAIDDHSTVILDSRSVDEFTGKKSRASRHGHIKSAVNLDCQLNYGSENGGVCSLNLDDELISMYRDRLNGASKVICYCNSGNRASVSYLALRSLGIDAAVYDGSWLEWGNEPELPIESNQQEYK